MTEKNSNFIGLIRSVIFGTPMPKSVDWQSIARLTRAHNVSSITAEALSKFELVPDDIAEALCKKSAFALFADVSQQREIALISDIFEANAIQAILLKGAVIKNYYPQTSLRTMADVDILIHSSDEGRVHTLLLENGYLSVTFGGKKENTYTKGCVTLEIHKSFFIYEDSWARLFEDKASELYAFNRCVPINKMKYIYKMDNELMLVYMLSHIAKHMHTGGIGVKAFLDIAVLLSSVEVDFERVNSDLERLNLYDFAQNAIALANYWFTDEALKNENSEELAEFILRCGAYGRPAYFIAANEALKKDSVSLLPYAFRRAFPSRESMLKRYPVLQKNRLLLPFCYIKRLWFSCVKSSIAKKCVKNELRTVKKINPNQVKQLQSFYKRIGL